MPDRFVYRLAAGEHQIIDTSDYSVWQRIDADPRYPANGGMMKRYVRELNSGKR